jgi:hypothetical protein
MDVTVICSLTPGPRAQRADPAHLRCCGLLHKLCQSYEPWRRPRVQEPRRRRDPWRGDRRSSGHRDARASPVNSRSAWVTHCPGIVTHCSRKGGPRGSGPPRSRPGTRGADSVAGWARGCSYVLRNGQAAHHWARSRPGTRGEGAAARWHHEGESDDMRAGSCAGTRPDALTESIDPGVDSGSRFLYIGGDTCGMPTPQRVCAAT